MPMITDPAGRRRRRGRLAALLLLAPLAAPAAAAATAAPAGAEVLIYQWKLRGFLGTLARIFIPGTGEGRLITGPVREGTFHSEIRVTSRHAGGDEFFAYGSCVDAASLRPVASWNESRFRGRDKRRDGELGEPDLIDIPSGIYLLRFAPPERSLRLRLWSDGKIYPVALQSHGLQMRRHRGGQVVVEAYAVRGLDVPGERRWDGLLEMWVTHDEASIPLEIVIKRDGTRVVLTYDPEATGERAAAAPR